MAYERLVGLNVEDEAGYTAYRQHMTPLLNEYGGAFRYDFRIEETLRSEASHPINRLFLIGFADRASHDGFFADPRYLDVKRAHFEPAVRGATTLAEIGS